MTHTKKRLPICVAVPEPCDTAADQGSDLRDSSLLYRCENLGVIWDDSVDYYCGRDIFQHVGLQRLSHGGDEPGL